MGLWSIGLNLLPAQNQTEEIAASLPEHQRSLGFSVAHLLDPIQPGIYVAYQHRHKALDFMRYQLGYLHGFYAPSQAGLEALHGLRVRAGWRRFREALIDRGRAPFLGLSTDYRYLDARMSGDFERSNFQFTERIDYEMWQHSLTFNVMTGYSIALSQQLRIEVGVGAGLRFNHRRFSALPADANFLTTGNILLWGYDRRQGLTTTLAIPVIFELSYYW